MPNRKERRLIHGGHKGIEAEFGQAAEKWGVAETTISFEGHQMERAVNVEVLDDETLAQGRVSLEFVFQRMGRRFVRGKGLRRVMKSMFHFITRADELFAVGWIQDNGTIKGGTGWGVELAKVFNRRVHVFDQGKQAWFTWDHEKWTSANPRLPEGAFAATGTRDLTPTGKQAIHDLFERSVETAGTAAGATSTDTVRK